MDTHSALALQEDIKLEQIEKIIQQEMEGRNFLTKSSID